MEAHFRNSFIPRRRLLLTGPGSAFTFDSYTGFREIGKDKYFGCVLPVDSNTALNINFGNDTLALIDLETEKEVRRIPFEITGSIGLSEMTAILLDDWIYIPSSKLTRVRRDLSEKQESVHNIEREIVGAVEVGGKIVTVHQDSPDTTFSTGTSFQLVVWETKDSEMRVLKRFKLSLQSETSFVALRKVDDSHILAANREVAGIWDINTKQQFPLNLGDIDDIDLFPRKFHSKARPVIVIAENNKIDGFGVVVSVGKSRFEITKMPGIGTVSCFDENHTLAMNEHSEYEIWWFDSREKQKGQIVKGKLEGLVSKIHRLSLSKKDQLESLTRMRNELESYNLPIPTVLSELIVKFI